MPRIFYRFRTKKEASTALASLIYRNSNTDYGQEGKQGHAMLHTCMAFCPAGSHPERSLSVVKDPDRYNK